MVDALDLGSSALRHGGSSPFSRTIHYILMTLTSLIIIVAPAVQDAVEIDRSQRASILRAVRQLKRLGIRVGRVITLDTPEARYTASALRKKNIVRGKPVSISQCTREMLNDVAMPDRVAVVVGASDVVSLMSSYLGSDFLPVIDPLTTIELSIDGPVARLRSVIPVIMQP